MGKLLRMSWRNVWRNGRRTVIALLGITLGLALLIFFDSFMAGESQAVYGNAVRLQGGNVQVHASGYRERSKRLPLLPIPEIDAVIERALAQPHVLSAARRINTGGMVSSREGTFPVVIIGIEPEREAATSLVAENVAAGRFLAVDDRDALLIGQALAARLEVGLGDRVALVGRDSHEQMRRRTMTIVGLYDLSLPGIEKGMVYVTLSEAQALFGLRDQATEVVVALQSVGQEGAVVTALQAALPAHEVDSWDTLSPEFGQAMEWHRTIMDIFALVILLIAGIGILNLELMAVFERTREIGLLTAMGLKQYEVLVLFLLEGVLIGVLGAVAGSIAGVALSGAIGAYGISIGGMTEASDLTALVGERIYPQLSLGILAARAPTVAIMSAVAALYPAWRASRQEPAHSLHYV